MSSYTLWYGWAISVLLTAGVGHEDDLTRAK
jgi:hypothetical protein